MWKATRILIIVGGVWSLAVAGSLFLFVSLFSMTDRFNGPHTTVLIVITLVEIGLLVTLRMAYRQHYAALFLLMAWFALAAGLQNNPFTLREWWDTLQLLLIVLAPITALMPLLGWQWYANRH